MQERDVIKKITIKKPPRSGSHCLVKLCEPLGQSEGLLLLSVEFDLVGTAIAGVVCHDRSRCPLTLCSIPFIDRNIHRSQILHCFRHVCCCHFPFVLAHDEDSLIVAREKGLSQIPKLGQDDRFLDRPEGSFLGFKPENFLECLRRIHLSSLSCPLLDSTYIIA